MLYVCNLADMAHHAAALRPSHLVSLVAPEEMPASPPGLRPSRHLRLGVHDIVEPLAGHVLPEPEHVRALITFARRWNRRAPMLVHCVAGVSRSMAAALVIATIHAGGRERELAERLREQAPHANPNRRIIALGDALLGRGGQLVEAVEHMGPAEPLERGVVVSLALPSAPRRPAGSDERAPAPRRL